MSQKPIPDYPVSSDKICPLCGGTTCFCVGSEKNNYRKFDCESFNRTFAIGATVFDCADDIEKRRMMNLAFEHIIERNKFLFYFYDDKYEVKEHENDHINLADIQYPTSFADRVDRVLINLSRAFPNYADTFEANRSVARLFFSETEEDDNKVPFIHLMEDLGYIKEYYVNKYSISADGWKRIDTITQLNQNSKQGFIAMEFSDDTKEIGEDFSCAIRAAGYSPMIIRDKDHNNQIVPEILSEIDKSRFLVMDASFPNYGAYYEAGYALGKGKQVIICCSEERFDDEDKQKRPHFDIAQKSMVIWRTREELVEKLRKRIKATV
jgi:nucleoside 2-deoxyribosyltransferase